jgi:hypothetical protein
MKLIRKVLRIFGGDGFRFVTRIGKRISTALSPVFNQKDNAVILNDFIWVRIIRTTGYPNCNVP